jgi:hypothetical protein
MFFNLIFILGVGMFVHYGCQILKHDVDESTWFMQLALVVTFIGIVLILRACYLQDIWHLAYGFALYAASQTPLSLYMWYYGMTYKRAAKRVHGTDVTDFVSQIRKQL